MKTVTFNLKISFVAREIKNGKLIGIKVTRVRGGCLIFLEKVEEACKK